MKEYINIYILKPLAIIITITIISSGTLTLTNEINYQINLRKLESKHFSNSSSKNSSAFKLQSKLLQTVYSDSFSKNYYYTTLYIGPLHKKQTYVIDTGSSIISSPCKPCPFCGSNKKNYYFTYNKNYKPLICGQKICKLVQATNCLSEEEKNKSEKLCSFEVKRNNGDGLKGYFLKEIVYFEANGNKTSLFKKKIYRSYALPIGCTTSEYGKYKELKTDGIMGINNNEKSFINLLYNLKIIKKNVFSLCFSLRGGYMSLGEIDKTYHKGKEIGYVPLLPSDIFYMIKIKDITIGNNKEKIYGKNTVAIIDTGNTISYFPSKIYESLIKEFNNYCKNKTGKCGNFTFEPNLGYCATFKDRESLFRAIYNHWPNITLYLDNNTKYIWKPINYYYYYFQLITRKACLGFNSYKSEKIILGTNFIHGYDIIFDRGNKKLGFVPADCSRGNLLINRMKGNIKNSLLHISRTNPTLFDKEIHKNEGKGKFNFGDNTKNDVVDFIQGHNAELDFNGDFNLVNLIILISSIVIVIVVLIIIISNLICDKKGYLKYEKHEMNEYVEGTNVIDNSLENVENKISFDDK